MAPASSYSHHVGSGGGRGGAIPEQHPTRSPQNRYSHHAPVQIAATSSLLDASGTSAILPPVASNSSRPSGSEPRHGDSPEYDDDDQEYEESEDDFYEDEEDEDYEEDEDPTGMRHMYRRTAYDDNVEHDSFRGRRLPDGRLRRGAFGAGFAGEMDDDDYEDMSDYRRRPRGAARSVGVDSALTPASSSGDYTVSLESDSYRGDSRSRLTGYSRSRSRQSMGEMSYDDGSESFGLSETNLDRNDSDYLTTMVTAAHRHRNDHNYYHQDLDEEEEDGYYDDESEEDESEHDRRHPLHRANHRDGEKREDDDDQSFGASQPSEDMGGFMDDDSDKRPDSPRPGDLIEDVRDFEGGVYSPPNQAGHSSFHSSGSRLRAERGDDSDSEFEDEDDEYENVRRHMVIPEVDESMYDSEEVEKPLKPMEPIAEDDDDDDEEKKEVEKRKPQRELSDGLGSKPAPRQEPAWTRERSSSFEPEHASSFQHEQLDQRRVERTPTESSRTPPVPPSPAKKADSEIDGLAPLPPPPDDDDSDGSLDLNDIVQGSIDANNEKVRVMQMAIKQKEAEERQAQQTTRLEVLEEADEDNYESSTRLRDSSTGSRLRDSSTSTRLRDSGVIDSGSNRGSVRMESVEEEDTDKSDTRRRLGNALVSWARTISVRYGDKGVNDDAENDDDNDSIALGEIADDQEKARTEHNSIAELARIRHAEEEEEESDEEQGFAIAPYERVQGPAAKFQASPFTPQSTQKLKAGAFGPGNPSRKEGSTASSVSSLSTSATQTHRRASVASGSPDAGAKLTADLSNDPFATGPPLVSHSSGTSAAMDKIDRLLDFEDDDDDDEDEDDITAQNSKHMRFAAAVLQEVKDELEEEQKIEASKDTLSVDGDSQSDRPPSEPDSPLGLGSQPKRKMSAASSSSSPSEAKRETVRSRQLEAQAQLDRMLSNRSNATSSEAEKTAVSGESRGGAGILSAAAVQQQRRSSRLLGKQEGVDKPNPFGTSRRGIEHPSITRNLSRASIEDLPEATEPAPVPAPLREERLSMSTGMKSSSTSSHVVDSKGEGEDEDDKKKRKKRRKGKKQEGSMTSSEAKEERRRKRKEEKSRKHRSSRTSSKSKSSRRTHRTEALEELSKNVRDTLDSLDDFGMDELRGRRSRRSRRRKDGEIDKTVRILIFDKNADEDGAKGDGVQPVKQDQSVPDGGGKNGSLTKSGNPCRDVLKAFEDLIKALIRISDELELSSTFTSKESVLAVVDADALNRALSHTHSIDVSFSEIKPILMNHYDRGNEMEGTPEAEVLQRIRLSVGMIAKTVRKVSDRQEWNAKSETCYVTLLELLQRSAFELKSFFEDVGESEWKVSPVLRRAWLASNHNDQVTTLYNADSQDRRIFRRLAMEVIRQTDEWAPNTLDLRLACGLSAEEAQQADAVLLGLVETAAADGLSRPTADAPDLARAVLQKIKGPPVPREMTVLRVVRRLLPSSREETTTVGRNDNGQGGLPKGGTTIAISSLPEVENDPSAVGMGGVGKTTLAAVVACREDVRRHYFGGVVWLELPNLGEQMGYTQYCKLLLDVCEQLKLTKRPSFPELLKMPGEVPTVRERLEQKAMENARDLVSELIKGSKAPILIVLDDAWRDQEVDWFLFRVGKRKLCDLLLTTRIRDLMVSDTVEVDLLTTEEAVELLMTESDHPRDHVMASSLEAKAIVRECAYHPLAIRCVGRWLGLKHATAGVISSVEELQDDVARSLERISRETNVAAAGTEDGAGTNMIYEIMSQSMSPAIDGVQTKVIKLCFAAYVLVFCQNGGPQPEIPMEAADDLFEMILQLEESTLIEEGSIFESHKRDATLLIPEALVALGVFEMTRKDDVQGKSRAYLKIHHEIQQEYGEHLFLGGGGLSALVTDAERRWNRVYVNSCLREMNEVTTWDSGTTSDRAYALEMIASHMLRARMFKELESLLRDASFVRGRLALMGYEKGTRKHIKDTERLYKVMKKRSTESRVDPVLVMVPPFNTVAAVLREESSLDELGHRRCSLKEAGLASMALAFSLAENDAWTEAITHYSASHDQLSSSLGDVEIVADVLLCMGVTCFEVSDFDKALESFEDCIRVRLALYGEDDSRYAQALYKKGDVLASMSDYPAAMEAYNKALKVMQVEPNRNRVDIGNTLHSIACVHYTKGELDKAMKSYKEALRCKKIELGFNHQDLAATYRQMGYIFSEKGDILSAIPLLEEAIRLLQVDDDDNAENKSDVLSIEGIMFIMRGNQDKGLECYEQALELLKEHIPHKKGKIATLLNLVACEYVARGDNKKAFRLFEESLHVRRKMMGYVHLDVASTLANMASLQQNREKHDKALKCLEEALRIRKLRLGDSEQVAFTLEKIGSISRLVGDHKKAELAYEEALRVRRVVHGNDNENVAMVLHELGDLMDDICEYDEAISYFRECLDIRRKQLGEDNEEVAATLYSMGFALHNRGDHNSSMACFEEALRIRRIKFGDEHPSVGDTLNMMGFVQAKHGDLESSLRLLWDALTIRKLNGDSLKASDTLKNTGNVHRELQQFDMAVKCYGECLRLRREAVGDEHEKVADVLIALGNVKGDMTDYDGAMIAYQEALQIRILLHGDFDDRVASVLQNMGIMEFRSGNLEKGRQFLEEFMRIRKANHTDESADYVNVLFIIGNIHKIQGNSDEAKEAWGEAYDIFNGIGLAEENPQIASVLENLLSEDERKARRRGIGFKLDGLAQEKVIKARIKAPIKAVSGAALSDASSVR